MRPAGGSITDLVVAIGDFGRINRGFGEAAEHVLVRPARHAQAFGLHSWLDHEKSVARDPARLVEEDEELWIVAIDALFAREHHDVGDRKQRRDAFGKDGVTEGDLVALRHHDGVAGNEYVLAARLEGFGELVALLIVFAAREQQAIASRE